MAIKKTALNKILSGVSGLDELTLGGFKKGSNVIISGTPGTGKTTLCLQFLVEGAKQGSAGLFVSLSENTDSIIENSRQFSWELDELIKKKLVHFVLYQKFVSKQSNEEKSSKVSRLIDQIKFYLNEFKNIERIVIDSVSLFSYQFKDLTEQRTELDLLFQFLSENKVTSLFILERQEWNNSFTFEDFLADGIIVMQDVLKDFERKRGITVIKLRGSDIERNMVPYAITQKGIEVYPNSQII